MVTAMKLSTFAKLNRIFYEVVKFKDLCDFEIDIRNQVDQFISYELSDQSGNILVKGEIKDE